MKVSCVASAPKAVGVAARAPRHLVAKAPAAPTPAPRREVVVLRSTLAPVAVLAGINPFVSFLQGQADTFKGLNLPEPLIHWGHPANMGVVLLAMGVYGGGVLGWTIRLSDDGAAVAKARDLHPKLAAGALGFFALGGMGGAVSLLMQGKPLAESPHFLTAMAGLALLALQAMLPLFFEDDPQARNIHAYLGSATLALLLVHGALGLQLGLSL